MVSYRLVLALLAVVAASAVVEARVFHDDVLSSAGRQLQQTAVNPTCPAGCDVDGGGCVPDATSGGYRCIKCLNKLMVSNADGRCWCAAGRWAENANDCSDCPKGSYCAGGEYVAQLNPNKVDCPSAKLTTLGKRSVTQKACVNIAGTSYSVDSAGVPSATDCPKDTYGPGLRKQRSCVPCPTGFITDDATARTSATQCVVPEGYFLRGPGQVAACPKGEYKAGTSTTATCTKCAVGVTTESEGSNAEADCKVLLPGVYASVVEDGIIKTTKKCPQSFVCPGGVATAQWDAVASPDLGTMKVEACSQSLWTEAPGASSSAQCLTPPGHYTPVSGSTVPCALGSYRADWKPASAARDCDVCGVGIQTDAASMNDQITIYDAGTYAETKMDVATASSACFILPGQGMYFNPVDSKFRAQNCIDNSYGVNARTTGLAAFPCRTCPAGLVTSTNATTYPTSAGFYKTHTAFGSITPQGFNDTKACVTKAGWGYNGRVSTQCRPDSYNAADTYGSCTQCSPGLTTSGAAASQATVADCKMAPGYGFHNGNIGPCPIGFYRGGLGTGTEDECTPCGDGLTTSRSGGVVSTDCNVCLPGWGGSASCGTQCGGSAADATTSAAATYGPAGRALDSATPTSSTCLACPSTMAVGFSFDFEGTNQLFKPISVARTGASSGADCLAQFAQIEDLAWYLPATGLTAVASATTFDDCALACTGDCQFVTFNYAAIAAERCQKKVNTAVTNGDVVAFKALLAGDIAASSVKVKNLVSGSYTFWGETVADGALGTLVDNAAATVTGCLAACDSDAACAAVLMAGVTDSSDTITASSCKLVRGTTTVAQWKRTVTKTAVSKLTKAAAL